MSLLPSLATNLPATTASALAALVYAVLAWGQPRMSAPQRRGFLVLACVNSTGWVPPLVQGGVNELSRWCLVISISALGMKTRLRELAAVGIPISIVGLLYLLTVGRRLIPEHEQAARRTLLAALPTLHVSISSEVCPEIREYERVSTTVANAYIKPLADSYLDLMSCEIAQLGIKAPLHHLIVTIVANSQYSA